MISVDEILDLFSDIDVKRWNEFNQQGGNQRGEKYEYAEAIHAAQAKALRPLDEDEVRNHLYAHSNGIYTMDNAKDVAKEICATFGTEPVNQELVKCLEEILYSVNGYGWKFEAIKKALAKHKERMK